MYLLLLSFVMVPLTIANAATVTNSKQPTTKDYQIVNIEKDGTYSPIASYTTFNEANKKIKTQQGIISGGKFVKIPAGFVATNTQRVTSLYKQPTFSPAYEYTGVAPDTELVYVDATEDYVKVNMAGQDLYVKHQNVTLIPTAAAKGQSYYFATNKGLWHHIYHHHVGTYDSGYLIGEKPKFLKNNVKYYSANGVDFYTAKGQKLGESYAYFQYLSPRTATSYSAKELDVLIAKELKAKEQIGNAIYAKASTNSPIQNLGTLLKEIEQEHHINALLILSMALHESNYGMSCHAQNYHNLFGLNVTDSNDRCSDKVDTTSPKYFASIEENILALVTELNTYYLNPLNMSDWRYNGLALGNKMIGINVRYASDPYWGAKIAGHMYRLDHALGGNDYKQYNIGFTNLKNVSVRTEPIVTTGTYNNRAYQYKLDWTIKRLDLMPITLSNTTSETTDWLRIISELSTDVTDLYTSIDNVRNILVH